MDKESVQKFIQNVDALPSGDRATLRKMCGHTVYEADAKSYKAFIAVLPDSLRYQKKIQKEDLLYLVATLRCMWHPEDGDGKAMDEVLAALAQTESSSGVLHRLESLCDLPLDLYTDSYFSAKLWRFIKLIKSQGYVIDMVSLYDDLERWNYDNKPTQRQWIRKYVENAKKVEE